MADLVICSICDSSERSIPYFRERPGRDVNDTSDRAEMKGGVKWMDGQPGVSIPYLSKVFCSQSD